MSAEPAPRTWRCPCGFENIDTLAACDLCDRPAAPGIRRVVPSAPKTPKPPQALAAEIGRGLDRLTELLHEAAAASGGALAAAGTDQSSRHERKRPRLTPPPAQTAAALAADDDDDDDPAPTQHGVAPAAAPSAALVVARAGGGGMAALPPPPPPPPPLTAPAMLEEELEDGRRVMSGPEVGEKGGWLKLTYSPADEKMLLQISGRRENPRPITCLGISRTQWAALARCSSRAEWCQQAEQLARDARSESRMYTL